MELDLRTTVEEHDYDYPPELKTASRIIENRSRMNRMAALNGSVAKFNRLLQFLISESFSRDPISYFIFFFPNDGTQHATVLGKQI